MLNAATLRIAMAEIAKTMAEQKQYLVELDQRNGDGDLGISMADGYAAADRALLNSEETDLGKLMFIAGKAFNEAAPSSLGTITSLGMMGMAKTLKGNSEADIELVGKAFQSGVEKIMEHAGSKPGEKTILDALVPAVTAILENAAEGGKSAFHAAAVAAKLGSESTACMKAVHGRAAYYGDQTIGLIDGGSVVGQLLFEAISRSVQS